MRSGDRELNLAQDRHLQKIVYNFEFYKDKEFYCLAEKLLAFQEGLRATTFRDWLLNQTFFYMFLLQNSSDIISFATFTFHMCNSVYVLLSTVLSNKVTV